MICPKCHKTNPSDANFCHMYGSAFNIVDEEKHIDAVKHEVDKEFITGKELLLIDDICTTGATFEEMINTLKSADVKNIACFATASPI